MLAAMLPEKITGSCATTAICAAQRHRIEIGDVDAVEADGAALRREEAQHQLEDGGFAGARRTHQRHRLARRDGQARNRAAPRCRGGWDNGR